MWDACQTRLSIPRRSFYRLPLPKLSWVWKARLSSIPLQAAGGRWVLLDTIQSLRSHLCAQERPSSHLQQESQGTEEDGAPFVSVFYVPVIWGSFSEQTVLSLGILIFAAFFRALMYPQHLFLSLKIVTAALLHVGIFIWICPSHVYLRFSLLPMIASS